MPRNKYYCQCLLRRHVEGNALSYYEIVSWIPSDVAVAGLQIRLKQWPKDEWSPVWTVMAVGPKRDGGKIEAQAGDYKNMRKETDAYRGKEGHWEQPDRRGKKSTGPKG